MKDITRGLIQEPKVAISRRILQWLAVIPALLIPSVREWFVRTVQEDRDQRVTYQRYLNRKH